MNKKMYIIILSLFVLAVSLFVPTNKELFTNISTRPSLPDININAECRFSGRKFGKEHEIGECSVAYEIVPNCKNVLEIGGGAGKVSHAININLADPTQHVVVEPGSKGRGNHGDFALGINKEKFGDKYTIVKKFANDLTKDDLAVLNEPVDCLFVDCEGCLMGFQNTPLGKEILSKARFVVNEMDGNNDAIRSQWLQAGFKKYKVGYGCGTNCTTEVWKNR